MVVKCDLVSNEISSGPLVLEESNSSNTNFIHHFHHFRKHHNSLLQRSNKKFLDNSDTHRSAGFSANNNMRRESLPHVEISTKGDEQHQQQMQIFLNQSNNIYILAKYGQTVSLPCIIYRQNNQDLTNVNLNKKKKL